MNIESGKEYQINSLEGWAKHSVKKENTKLAVTFIEPISNNLPKGLKVVVTIGISGSKSAWDYAVKGMGNKYSLINVISSKFSLKKMPNDNFFIPKYSGKLLSNPFSKNYDLKLLYPRGWSTSMQYLAYYGSNLGVYFGFHDPKAAVKKFYIKTNNNSLDFSSEVIIADKTLAGNDWEFPGLFELDIFKGDWFDAANIYKNWASKNADYWPKMTPEREKRQNKLGQIGIWAYYSAKPDYPMQKIEKDLRAFIKFFAAVPVGIHWYNWNYHQFDDDYPDYFPERSGMKDLISRLKSTSNAAIMPYINGRLFDTDLSNYQSEGYPYATKDGSGEIYSQDFNHNHFAVMCPAQKPWQQIIANVAKRLGNDLGASGIYIDQVAAAGPSECMDKNHGHSLGGGSWWHDGYQEMFKAVHEGLKADKFLTVEGANDYLADQVDGFLTEGWLSDNLVPAFQVVYGGRVQLFGRKAGTSEYHKASFYAKLSQAFVTGIQPGRNSSWLVFDPNADIARPFVRQTAIMRYKLRDFLSFGSMQRPLELSGRIPKIVSTWKDYGQATKVSIPAIQSSVYKDKAGKQIALIFANASLTETVDFSFDFNAGNYGLAGKIMMKKISELKDGEGEIVDNSSVHNLSLKPLQIVALVFARGED